MKMIGKLEVVQYLCKSLNSMPLELDLKSRILGKLQKNINHVLRHVILNPFLPLNMFIQDVLHEHIKLLAQSLHPLYVTLQVQEINPRNKVPNVIHPIKQKQLIKHLLELIRRNDSVLGFFKVLFSQHHAADNVEAKAGKVVF